MPPHPSLIYNLCRRPDWNAAVARGEYRGSADDIRDGFIHFSTAQQAEETAARHFAGQPDLVLVTVDADALGARLRWEPSRGGALFPHLYGDLPLSVVRSVVPLPLGADGRHEFPRHLPLAT